eukprot:s1616_g6.t1
MASEGTPGLGFTVPTEESFDVVAPMESDAGEDYMMLETPKSSTGLSDLGETPATVLEASLNNQFLSGEALMATIPDELKTKTRDDLGDQLAELESTLHRLGLGTEAAPGPTVASGTGGDRDAHVLTGFVRASTTSSTTVQTLEKEVISVKLDKEKGTFLVEGWETVYTISKRSYEYNELLKVKHTKQKWGAMDTLMEKDPGTLPTSVVCMNCYLPSTRGPRCLACRCTETVDLASAPLGVIEFAGTPWELRYTSSGATWLPADGQASSQAAKDPGSLDAGDLGQVPRPAAAHGADPALVSFSEQVPASERISLRQQVTEMGTDSTFFLQKDQPQTSADLDETQSAIIPESV